MWELGSARAGRRFLGQRDCRRGEQQLPGSGSPRNPSRTRPPAGRQQLSSNARYSCIALYHIHSRVSMTHSRRVLRSLTRSRGGSIRGTAHTAPPPASLHSEHSTRDPSSERYLRIFGLSSRAEVFDPERTFRVPNGLAIATPCQSDCRFRCPFLRRFPNPVHRHVPLASLQLRTVFPPLA